MLNKSNKRAGFIQISHPVLELYCQTREQASFKSVIQYGTVLSNSTVEDQMNALITTENPNSKFLI